MHGTQVDQHEESPAESADDELEKETNLLKTEIMLMKKSLTEVSKLNTDLKVVKFLQKNPTKPVPKIGNFYLKMRF